MDCQVHRQRHGSLLSARRVIALWLGRSRLFLSPCAVLMSSYNGRVDHGVCIVGIICQDFEKILPNATLGPTRKPCVYVFPSPEPFRQIAPRRTRPELPDHCFDNQSIATVAIAANCTRTTRQEILDPCKLIITQTISFHREASTRRLTMNHALPDLRIP
jgi:hypothetical protein